MLFRTHFVFGLAIYLIFLKFIDLDFASSIVFGIFFFLAILFVDIDSKNSKIGKMIIFRPLQWILSHRGLVHSLLFSILLSLLIFILDNNAGIAFFAGYMCHLVGDMLTVGGVKLFWPVYSGKISLYLFKTGGLIEEILFVLLILFNVVFVLSLIF